MQLPRYHKTVIVDGEVATSYRSTRPTTKQLDDMWTAASEGQAVVVWIIDWR